MNGAPGGLVVEHRVIVRLPVWSANPACYTPRPIAPTGIGAG